MSSYYNEHDAFAAAWLRELIKAGLISDGEVDERDIQQVEASDLRGFTQCHFFAGIGVWSYALRNAGWPDDLAVWTGSCPCQGFSASGKRGGFSDQRHLWPAWFRLIAECRPDTVFGEQVASKDGLAWFDVVSADLEGAGYAVGTTDTCAAGFGAPHIRSRLYFVADSGHIERAAWPTGCQYEPRAPIITRLASDGADVLTVADDQGERCREAWPCSRRSAQRFGDGSELGELGHAGDSRLPQRSRPENGRGTIRDEGQTVAAPGLTNGFWRDAEWLWCRDGKYRPVEPGTFPLAHGIAKRVGKLRGFGNAIVAPQAEEFVRAFLEL